MSRSLVVTEGLKALNDPIRWSIVRQVAAGDELACSRLEETLPVSKPTISYHTKVLVQAGLIEVRRRGRHSFYTLRRDVLEVILGELRALAVARDAAAGSAAVTALVAERVEGGHVDGSGIATEAALLTW